MKNKADFSQERDEDLVEKLMYLLHNARYIQMPTIYKELANQPAKRFYVSEKRAAVVVGKLMRGEDIGDMRPQRKEMFFEILRRVNELSKVRTNTSVSKLVAEVVAQPAPSFYLTEGSAKVIVCRIRRENRKKRNQRS